MHSAFSSRTRRLMQKWATPIYLICLILSILVACVPLLDFNPSPWLVFLGAFHPIILHLPIGSVILLACMELVRLFTKGRWNPQTLFVVFFAAVTSIPAVLLGQAAFLAEKSPESLEEHMQDGVVFAVLMIVVFAVKFYSEQKRSRLVEKIYQILFFITTLVMIAAAHHGGEYTHGSPMQKAPWKSKQEKVQKPVVSTSSDMMFYEEVVEPIFAQHCYSCHGEKKDKGGFRMHTWELLEKALDRDDPLNGDLLYSILLPLEDEEHMPPMKEEQLTQRQVNLIKWWAENGHQRGKTMRELKVPSILFD